ncbi:N-acetylglucosamine kinase [Fredinandcohnia humi]
MYVIGIDGGGTKTKGIIADENGTIYAMEQVGATNQNGVDLTVIERELTELFSSLEEQNKEAFSKVHTVFAGMAGVDRPEAKERMEGIFSKLVPGCAKIIIDNDGVNALYSGTLGFPGIVQISGTGSITFGINDKGERKRVGGWGYLIDDEGSGYDIGRAALHAVFKAHDGRGPETALTEMIRKHFTVSDTPELIAYIYGSNNPRSVIAPLSKYVTIAADRGDEMANHIIRESSSKLVHSIKSLYLQLFSSSQKVPVVLVGGLFSRLDLFLPAIESMCKQWNLPINLQAPKIEPVGGAAAAALVSAGCKLEESFVENMKRNEIIVQ